MKQKFQLALFSGMIFLASTTSGQTTKPESAAAKKTAHTYLNIMVNVVSTNLYYGGSNKSLADYKKSANGIQAGFSFQAGITPGFSVVPELYFMRKGGILKNNNPFTGSESTLRFNTLEVPVLARFHMGRLYFNAGPSVAYNISGKQKMNDQSVKLSFDNTSGGFRRFDAGVQMGGGFEFPLKQKRLALDIRYVHGLTNMARGAEMYNRALMISVNFSKAWKSNPLAKK